MDKADFSYRTGAKLRSLTGYSVILGRRLRNIFSFHKAERELNQLLVGYPHNHNYSIGRKNLWPGFQLYERDRLVTPLIPEDCKSFLDIGSCKGYYVLRTAMRCRCQVSAGIDIHEPFIATSQKVGEYLGVRNARFYLSDLEQLSSNPEAFGGPFQVVLLIGTYQYLFWGSGLNMKAFYSHEEILSRLSKVCTQRIIFSARLEADWLSGGIKEKARLLKKKIPYSTAHFLEAAGRYFQIQKAGYLGKYPLFLMMKK
ncbi:MAG: class I SAM-dependent methyltransferase [Candidatus Aureabacteria bacterium]|nr:class I SAM-dependent methyltransferase [Candidatus Auribacterota bacterium]